MVELSWIWSVIVIIGVLAGFMGFVISEMKGHNFIMVAGLGMLMFALVFGHIEKREYIGKPIEFQELKEEVYVVEYTFPEVNLILLKQVGTQNNEQNKPRVVENAPKDLKKDTKFLIKDGKIFYLSP